MKRRLSLLILIVIVAFTLSIVAYANEEQSNKTNDNGTLYSDIGEGHWAYDAIKWMTEKNIMTGYPDHDFKPGNPITRGEFAKIMVLALNLKPGNSEGTTFKDVAKDNWAYPYVETAKYYLTGFRQADGDYFRSSDYAVREDMAVALVKACGLSGETADESVLDQYADRDSISANLKKYVALVISNGIMIGSDMADNGKKEFNPQGNLTRAEAAVLLYNVIEGNKVTYDGEKVTYDENVPVENTISSHSVPKVTAAVENGRLILMWERIPDEDFQGYKVVISKNNSSPQYPDNGYLYFITDRDKTYVTIDNSTTYNGGDFGSYLISGQHYYFSITAVYDDAMVPGNVINMEYRGSNAEASEHTAPKVISSVENGKLVLRWQAIPDEGFQGYKVVVSKNDSTPQYPDNGYLYYITDRNTTSAVIDNSTAYNGGDFGNRLVPGEHYYFSVTALYNDIKVPGNVLYLEYPGK